MEVMLWLKNMTGISIQSNVRWKVSIFLASIYIERFLVCRVFYVSDWNPHPQEGFKKGSASRFVTKLVCLIGLNISVLIKVCEVISVTIYGPGTDNFVNSTKISVLTKMVDVVR